MSQSIKSLLAISTALLFSVTVFATAFYGNTKVNQQESGDSLQKNEQQGSDQADDQQDDDTIIIPANDPDAVARRDFMRTKLMYTQNIFEGLTIGDFKAVDTAIMEVQMITEGEQWVTIDNEVYQRLTEEFKVSTRRLKKAAESRNIEATALRFYEMSNRCIDCHQHIRVAKYEL